jgi:hypothetical protein
VGSKSDSKAFGRLLCSRPKAKRKGKETLKIIYVICQQKYYAAALLLVLLLLRDRSGKWTNITF